MSYFKNIQWKFLEEVRKKIPDNISFAELLAEDLSISLDSAYRRIRGDTHLTFEEIMIICSRYDISLDLFFTHSNNNLVFNYRAVSEDVDLVEYFRSILKNLQTCRKYEIREMIYAAKEIPLFHLFMFPGLTAFKILFWFGNIFQFPAYRDLSYSSGLLTPEIREVTTKIHENYQAIPSTEIWNEDSIIVILRQIEYFFTMNRFESAADAVILLEELKQLTFHIERQAEHSMKITPGNKSQISKNTYHLFNNRIIISENTVYYKMGDSAMVHLGHNVMNIISTIEPEFCRHTYSLLQNLITSSICLNGDHETERMEFFDKMRNRIDLQIKSMQVY